MTQRLNQLFHFQKTALDLRAFRQQILASNIANADTPNFKARDINFGSALKNALGGNTGSLTLSTSSPRDLQAPNAGEPAQVLYSTAVEPSIDGNTVDMDVERNRFAQNAVHYEADLTVLTAKIKLLLSAITG